MYLFAKALHLVGVVSWFAGLFYLVRLFIYHVESAARPEPERQILHAQFVVMERRLWVMTVIAMVITMSFGTYLAVAYLAKLQNRLHMATWLFIKLGLVAGLFAYHQVCGAIRDQLADGRCRWTSGRLRQWNELATLLLVAIVMLAVLKSTFSALWGTLGLLVFGVLLAIAIKVMRRRLAPAPPLGSEPPTG
jgi:putative membrane protein